MANLPVPIPRTFGVNESETGAFLNSLRDALLFLLNPPQAVLVQATLQSLANATLTPITFDSAVADSYGGHSNVTNNSRYTAQVPGWYEVLGIVGFAANAAGSRAGQLFKNGVAIQYTQSWFVNDGANANVSVTFVKAFLAAGDYVELNGYQTTGGALNTAVAGPQSAMHVEFRHG